MQPDYIRFVCCTAYSRVVHFKPHLTTGAVISLLGPCCAEICPDMRKIGTMFGMVTGISSLAYVLEIEAN